MNLYICCSTDAEPEVRCRQISDRISDMWFNVNQIQTDLPNGSVIIPISSSKIDPCTLQLICTGIIGVNIEDSEKVVNYDIGKLRYLGRNRRIELWGNIPIRISIELQTQWKLYLEPV